MKPTRKKVEIKRKGNSICKSRSEKLFYFIVIAHKWGIKFSWVLSNRRIED